MGAAPAPRRERSEASLTLPSTPVSDDHVAAVASRCSQRFTGCESQRAWTPTGLMSAPFIRLSTRASKESSRRPTARSSHTASDSSTSRPARRRVPLDRRGSVVEANRCSARGALGGRRGRGAPVGRRDGRRIACSRRRGGEVTSGQVQERAVSSPTHARRASSPSLQPRSVRSRTISPSSTSGATKTRLVVARSLRIAALQRNATAHDGADLITSR